MDKIEITILADGTIKTVTDEIGEVNHQNAEAFLRTMSQMLGGELTQQRRREAHEHTHVGTHVHH